MENSVDKKTSKAGKAEILDQVIEMFEAADQSSNDARTLSERDRDYYDHKQLTEEERAELTGRKQPAIVINRIKPKVDFLLGTERSIRTDAKAFPRTPVHDKDADAATDAIRYVCDNNEFDTVRSEVFENMLIEGTGGAEIRVAPNSKGLMEVKIHHYPWDRLFWDPHSRARDFRDAKYLGAVVWMDYEDALDLGKAEPVELALAEPSYNETYDDTPRTQWVDKQRKRVRVVSLYYKKHGEWQYCLFTKGGFIQGPGPSAYLDEDGAPACGLELQSAFVDRDGNRYGSVRTLIDVQDEINKRRSKALHLLTMRQTLGEKGAVSSVAHAKRELAKPDGHIEITPDMRFELLNTNDMARGQLELLQEAKNEIDAVGANAALTGKEERVMSGVALQSRQQSGQQELGPVFDSLRMWQKRVYRQVWNRIRQYWREERWIRVTDEEDNLKWVGLNRPISLGEQLQGEMGELPPEYQADPRLQTPVGVENNLAELDVDIVLEDVPDVINLQSEQFQQLADMFRANPQAIPFDLIIEASTLRNKDKLLERMRGGDPDGDPEKAQMMQQMQQMAQALQMAQQEVQELQRGEQAKQMEIEAKLVESERKLEEAAIKRETTQIKANADIATAQINASSKLQ